MPRSKSRNAPAPPLRRSKRIAVRRQAFQARNARPLEEPEENPEVDVDWQRILLQELLADEEQREEDYEEIADKIIAEIQYLEEPERLLSRWGGGPSRWRGNQ